METILNVLVWAIKSTWPIPTIIITLGLLVYWLASGHRNRSAKFLLLGTVVLGMISSTLISRLGHLITVPIIYAIGVPAQGQVVSFYKTGDIYNERDVIAFKVVYPLADGKLFESSFKSNDFNVYPLRNTAHYPQVGTSFQLSYLARLPHYFIIVTES